MTPMPRHTREAALALADAADDVLQSPDPAGHGAALDLLRNSLERFDHHWRRRAAKGLDPPQTAPGTPPAEATR